jgi:hypothetical protein
MVLQLLVVCEELKQVYLPADESPLFSARHCMPPVKMMCRITAKYPRAVAAILYFMFISVTLPFHLKLDVFLGCIAQVVQPVDADPAAEEFIL